MTRPALPLGLLAALALAGCVTPPPRPAAPERIDALPSPDGDVPATDAASRARTGFPLGVVWAETTVRQPGGQVLRSVQFDLAQASLADIGAAPERICGFHGETLLSSQVRDPGPGDRDLPGTVVIDSLCRA